MKIYEKPVALIEKIEIEDVITASVVVTSGTLKESLETAAGKQSVRAALIFNWD